MAVAAFESQVVHQQPNAILEKSSWLLRLRSSKGFLVFVVSFAVFADQFIFAIIIPVIPFTLHSHVGVSEDSVQNWVSILLAVYGAATTIASPIWGWYADRHTSRRIPFLLGLIVITGAAIIIWLSRHIVLQVVGRIFLGLASAIVWVTALAMIADSVEEDKIGQCVGYLGTAMMIGMLLASSTGGVILDRVGYNAVFGVIMIIIAVDIILRLLVVEKAAATIEHARSDEERGDRIQHDDSEKIRTRTKMEYQERIVEIHPVTVKAGWETKIPVMFRMLSSRRLCVALLASLTIGTIFAGFETVLPLQTHQAFGWNCEGGGLIFLPLTLPSFLGPLVGRICDRYGPKWPMTAGFLFLCPVLTLLRYTTGDTLVHKILLISLLTLASCCLTLTLNPVMAEVAYVVNAQAKENPQVYGDIGGKGYAQAYGMFSTSYCLGNTIGPIFAGTIKNAAGWSTMGWSFGLISALTAIPVMLWSGSPAKKSQH